MDEMERALAPEREDRIKVAYRNDQALLGREGYVASTGWKGTKRDYSSRQRGTKGRLRRDTRAVECVD